MLCSVNPSYHLYFEALHWSAECHLHVWCFEEKVVNHISLPSFVICSSSYAFGSKWVVIPSFCFKILLHLSYIFSVPAMHLANHCRGGTPQPCSLITFERLWAFSMYFFCTCKSGMEAQGGILAKALVLARLKILIECVNLYTSHMRKI